MSIMHTKFLQSHTVYGSIIRVGIMAIRNMYVICCRFQKEEELREREALMSMKFEANDADTSIMIDHELRHHSHLNDANRGMDDLLSSGTGILSNIREQRVTLKGAHKKILDVANTLGLSNTVLRLIERRTYQDKFILYGGMIITCVIMFLVWKYLT